MSTIGATDAYAADPVELDKVKIAAPHTEVSDRSYERANALAAQVADVSKGRVGVGLLFTRTNAQVRLDDLQASLESDAGATPLRVLPGGIVMLDVLPKGAELPRLYINKEADALRVRGVILAPTVSASELTIGEMKLAVTAIDETMRSMTPALFRIFVSKSTAFSVCADTRGQAIAVLDGERVAEHWTTDTSGHDDAGRDVWCHDFRNDAATPDAWRVTPPANAQLLVLH